MGERGKVQKSNFIQQNIPHTRGKHLNLLETEDISSVETYVGNPVADQDQDYRQFGLAKQEWLCPSVLEQPLKPDHS